MKRLTLIRHGKSDHSFSLPDHERPLNQRGESDAAVIGELLRSHHPGFERVFSSSARRALTTAHIIAEKLGYTPENIVVDTALYTFDTDGLYRFVETVDDALSDIAIIGHNPAMTLLINELCTQAAIDNLPTCGIAELELSITEWVEIGPHKAKLVNFYRPKNYR